MYIECLERSRNILEKNVDRTLKPPDENTRPSQDYNKIFESALNRSF